MNEVLVRKINVKVPYVYTDGYAIATKTEQMSPIQSRIALMIFSSKELGIDKSTLGESITKVFGLLEFNFKAIKDEVEKLVSTGTIAIDKDKDIFGQKVGILRLRMNKGILSDISNDKYSLMTSITRRINKKIGLPVFKGLSQIEDPNLVSNNNDVEIKRELDYTPEQQQDILESSMEYSRQETLSEITLNRDSDIVWINHVLTVEVSESIKPKDEISKIIINLMNNGLIGSDVETLLNESLLSMELTKASNGQEVGVLAKGAKLEDSNDVIDTRYVPNKHGIDKYYYDLKSVKVESKKINLAFLRKDSVSYEEIIEANPKKLSQLLFDSFDNEAKNAILKFIIDGGGSNKEISEWVPSLVTKKNFISLNEVQTKNLIPSKTIFSEFFENNISWMNTIDILNQLFKLGYKNYEWFYLNTGFKYSSKRLFLDWELETKMFNAIEVVKSTLWKGLVKSDIEKIQKDFNKNISSIFNKQSIVTESNQLIQKMLKSSSEWTEDQIIGEGIKTRYKLEKIKDKYSSDKNNSFAEVIKNKIKPEKAKVLIKLWKEISSAIAHDNNLTLLSKENIVKNVIDEINKITPIKKEDLKIKKEGKNVTQD